MTTNTSVQFRVVVTVNVFSRVVLFDDVTKRTNLTGFSALVIFLAFVFARTVTSVVVENVTTGVLLLIRTKVNPITTASTVGVVDGTSKRVVTDDDILIDRGAVTLGSIPAQLFVAFLITNNVRVNAIGVFTYGEHGVAVLVNLVNTTTDRGTKPVVVVVDTTVFLRVSDANPVWTVFVCTRHS